MSISNETLACAQTYTDESLAGAGAVAGVPCQIQSIAAITGGNRVTFLWVDNNGVSHTSTMDVMNGQRGETGATGQTGAAGADGKDGVGIKSMVINSSNHLIITYTDDNSADAGEIPNVQADWNESDSSADSFIKNKPSLGTAASKDVANEIAADNHDLPDSDLVHGAVAAKQDKDLATPIIIGGENQTSVEGALGALNTAKADKTDLENEVVTRATLGAHNLLNIFNSEINVSGTYTEVINSDGTVTIGGTPTSACTIPYMATALYNGSVYNLKPSTNYVLDSGLSAISPLNVQVFTKADASASWTKIAETTSNISLAFTTPSSFYDVWARILIPANAVVPANTVVKPQIRLATDADTTYRTYVPTNNELLSYKDNGVLGAKNLLNIFSGTGTNCSVANNGFTNTNTDARDFFNFAVKALDSSSTMIDKMADQSITDAGEYSFDVTIPDNTAYILIQHVGSTRNIQISVPSSLKAGKYIFSFKVQSANPTTVGGLDVRNIMIRLATDTVPTYASYAMTNRELTEAVDGMMMKVGIYTKTVKGTNTTYGALIDQICADMKALLDGFADTNTKVIPMSITIEGLVTLFVRSDQYKKGDNFNIVAYCTSCDGTTFYTFYLRGLSGSGSSTIYRQDVTASSQAINDLTSTSFTGDKNISLIYDRYQIV